MKRVLLIFHLLVTVPLFGSYDNSSFFGYTLGNPYKPIPNEQFLIKPEFRYQKYAILQPNGINIPNDINSFAIALSRKTNTILGITAESKFSNSEQATLFMDKYYQLFSTEYSNWDKKAGYDANEKILTNGISELIFRNVSITDGATFSRGLIIFQPSNLIWKFLEKRANLEYEEGLLDGSIPGSMSLPIEIVGDPLSNPGKWISIQEAFSTLDKLNNSIPAPNPRILDWVENQEVRLSLAKNSKNLLEFYSNPDYLHYQLHYKLREFLAHLGLVKSDLISIQTKWDYVSEIVCDLIVFATDSDYYSLLRSKQLGLNEETIDLYLKLYAYSLHIQSSIGLEVRMLIDRSLRNSAKNDPKDSQ